MKYRVYLHSKAGFWEHYDGYVDVEAPTPHDAAVVARQQLRRTTFPDRPLNSWVTDKIETNQQGDTNAKTTDTTTR